MLPAEVQAAAAHGVVKETVALGPVAADIEGQVFVKGVAALGPKAHGVPGVKQKPPAGLVHRAALVPQAEDLLPFEPIRVVDEAPAQLPGKAVGKAAPVPVQQAPVRPGREAKVLQFNGKGHPVQGEGQGPLPLGNLRRGKLQALRGELVPAKKGRVAAGGTHAPGGDQRHALPDKGHPQHVGEEVQAHPHPVGFIDPVAFACLPQGEPMIEFHALGSPLVSILRRSFR